ncbi:hypothetical protein [Amycolatopsis sp. cmx-11-51]|uniref:hypothetical protein n=1 Tax=unclassified Amycolatopsis TaxID=2618356 RepID=UPI0039E34314
MDTARHLEVSVPEGAVNHPAMLSVVSTAVPPPERPGFVLASPPVVHRARYPSCCTTTPKQVDIRSKSVIRGSR